MKSSAITRIATLARPVAVICEELAEFYRRRPRPWRSWRGARSRKHERK